MFHTHTSAELKLPPALAPHGTQSWHWVELPLHLPYFCVSIGNDGEGNLQRQFIVAYIENVMRLLDTPAGKATNRSVVGLMSPDYMNGTDFYQMGRIKEVWKSADGFNHQYVMSDGKTIYDPMMTDGEAEQKFELILSL
ncbi:MAG: hypothetical protein WC710_05995 [Gallionella sp.]|jgi:hypothetical protein